MIYKYIQGKKQFLLLECYSFRKLFFRASLEVNKKFQTGILALQQIISEIQVFRCHQREDSHTGHCQHLSCVSQNLSKLCTPCLPDHGLTLSCYLCEKKKCVSYSRFWKETFKCWHCFLNSARAGFLFSQGLFGPGSLTAVFHLALGQTVRGLPMTHSQTLSLDWPAASKGADTLPSCTRLTVPNHRV